MAFLLDTHAFIWLTANDRALPDSLRQQINTAETVYLSIASLWEIAIKVNLGKLQLHQDYELMESILATSGIQLLPIRFADTAQVRQLERHHRDPFDRMIIAQAMTNSLAIVSVDGAFDAYPIRRVWA